ncbi:MAG: dienelactone hydrolase family protein [Candidatus Omnitrophica bacterium]|nr:dienelactone hydrolase family protein [Candidatus Omnitrophota bacterium]
MTGTVARVGGWASETVQFSSDGWAINAFLAKPLQGGDPAPAVLLLHEWWGLNDHIKDLARRLAQEGYAALAPDLYARLGSKTAHTPQEAAALMNALSTQAALRDLNAATSYLKTCAFVDPLRIGAMGLSMGGTLVLTQAAHNSDLKAAVAYYGKVPPLETLDYLLCPVLYHAAGNDAWVTKQEVDRLLEGREKYGKSIDVYWYPEADHSFFNDARPAVYRAQDAALAWQRTMQFFQRYV